MQKLGHMDGQTDEQTDGRMDGRRWWQYPFGLRGNKMVLMEDSAYAFIWIKSGNMFPMYLQSGVPKHFQWRFVVLK